MKHQIFEIRFIALLRLTLLALLWPASTAFAVEVREYPVPTANSGIHQMTTGPDGSLWFTERGARKIGRLSPAGTITEFPLSETAARPELIVVGADGNVWFSISRLTHDRIGQLSVDGALRFFDLPILEPLGTSIVGLTAARGDVAIYLSTVSKASNGCFNVGKIFKIVPDGTITLVNDANARNLVFSQGNFWFSQNICDDLQPVAADLFKLSSDGAVQKLGAFAKVHSQIVTADGNIWALVTTKDGSIAILQPESPENRTAINRYFALRSLVEGANRDFWFIANNSVVRTGLDGRFDEYELGLGEPTSLVRGTNDTIWFSTPDTIFRLIPDEPGNLVIARSASYVRGAVATDSLVTIFGNALTTSTQVANTTPLPLELAGVKVIFTDSKGADHPAPLLYASPMQINGLVPASAQTGGATVKVVKSSGETVSTGKTIIDLLSPSLFTADSSGSGVAVAVALRVKPDGSLVYEAVSASNPIDLRAGGKVSLLLFGSGMCDQSDLNKVNAVTSVGLLRPSFVGPQGQFAGLSQVNIPLPEHLAGSGTIDLTLRIEGALSDRFTNTVNIPIK